MEFVAPDETQQALQTRTLDHTLHRSASIKRGSSTRFGFVSESCAAKTDGVFLLPNFITCRTKEIRLSNFFFQRRLIVPMNCSKYTCFSLVLISTAFQISTCSPTLDFLASVKKYNDVRTFWDSSSDQSQESALTLDKTLLPETSAREPRAQRGCGMGTNSITRIVGGRPADPSDWPWMVALLRQDAKHYCGGVLITDRHVLTAAHCVHKLRTRDIKVRLGEYDFSRRNEPRALDFWVTDIRIHEDFDSSNYNNDIAILKIHRPTAFNNYIWPICLPPIATSFENKTGIVTGWGTQRYGGVASNVLMEVQVPVWPQRLCVSRFTHPIPDSVMCAGAYEGGRDACQGDSGGPLLHRLGNGRWVNIGIVSWGIRCGEPGHPGIYTRVSTYLDWIFANAIF